MKRIILLLLFSVSLYAGVDPKKRDRQESIPEKSTPTRIITPEKSTSKRDRLLERVRLANPGQNARLLLKSPMHLRTFFPGTGAYTVR